jgi:GAF domain-containing protein
MATRTKSKRRANPVEALSAVTMRGFASVPEAAQAIFRLIHDLVGMRICVLTRIDLVANTLTVLEAFDAAGVGVVSGMELPADSMPCACVVRNAAALREYDLDAHPAFRVLPARTKLGLRSYVGVPLRRQDGTIWGTLAATDTEPREITDAHLHTLTVLARLAAFEFEREEQRQELAKQAEILAERLAMSEMLQQERIRAARLEAVLESAVTVSHEVNNPLAVLQLRVGRLKSRSLHGDVDTASDLDVCLESIEEIKQVTARLRRVVHPVSTHYLSGKTQMLDLAASIGSVDHEPS